MDLQLVEFDTVSSTNDLVKQAIENGSDEGLVVRADLQSGGYGRYGRAWKSPAGGLYMSVLLRPSSHIEDASIMATKLPTLSLLVSMMVRSAVIDLLGDLFADSIRIKWPNDIIFVGDSSSSSGAPMFRKLCGISLEKHKDAVCVGIGVNVKHADPGMDDGCAAESAKPDASQTDGSVRNSPIYLEDIVGSGDRLSVFELCKRVMKSLEAYYPKWLDVPFDHFKQEYDQALALNGMKVRIVDNRSSVIVEGEVSGVDPQGCLLVRTQDGCLESVASGEAHVNLV